MAPTQALSPSYTVPLLTHLSSRIASFSTPHLHPVLLPLSPLTLVHAVRVSLGVTQVQGGARRLPLVQSIALVWILLFGGWSLLRVALAQTSPLLEWDVQWTALVYGGIHALCHLTGMARLLIKVASTPGLGLAMDLFFDIVDAICRMEGIAALGIEPLRDHPSPLTPLLTSILIGGGGPLLIGLFNLDSPHWSLQTPTWLSQPTNLLAIDIWTSALVGWLYLVLSGPKPRPGTLLPRGLLAPTALGGDDDDDDDARPMLSRGEAQLCGSIVLAVLLTANRLRAYVAQTKNKAATPQQQQRGNKGSANAKKTKGDTTATATALPIRSVLLYLGLALPLSLIGLQYLLAGDNLGLNGWVTKLQ